MKERENPKNYFVRFKRNDKKIVRFFYTTIFFLQFMENRKTKKRFMVIFEKILILSN